MCRHDYLPPRDERDDLITPNTMLQVMSFSPQYFALLTRLVFSLFVTFLELLATFSIYRLDNDTLKLQYESWCIFLDDLVGPLVTFARYVGSAGLVATPDNLIAETGSEG